MKITKLRLTGFKSFVEPAELRIEPGLTGIVGPNGCGKSNLLEAIRWTMGESSARSLRGGGMEDVIFAGTATRPQRDFAEVSIHIDRAEPDQDGDTQAEIIRRIERGAGSAYRINGRDVRAKDVALLFADSATGAHSPALVSQGRISAIIAAKPAERRAMLEEAAGIAGLHVRRKDAEQKLRATETNLLRLDDLLADMEARASALRRQARAAERYRLLSDEIRIAEARLIFARWRDAAAAADLAKKEAERAEQGVALATEAQRAATAAQAEATQRLGDARGEAQAAREAESALTHRLALLRSERATLERRIAELGERRETLTHDRAREDRLALDASEAIARLEEEDKALAASLADTESRSGAVEGRVAEATEIVRTGEVALAQAMAAEAAQQAEVRVAEAALGAARQRLYRAAGEVKRIADELAALGDASAHEASRAQAEAVRLAADTAIAQANAMLADAEARRDAAAVAREAAEARGASARAAVAALQSEARALAKANAIDSGDRVLAHVSAAAGYEHALAAALGEDLDVPLGRWQGSAPVEGDPALPAGTVPLATHVTAPEALARRLAQIGVVEDDDGTIVLAVGQRLVTKDGRLRRWDGYVASGSGAAAAERLIRVNRLAELDRAMPAAEADVSAAETALGLANGDAAAARSAIEHARTTLAEVEQALRRAIREEDAATAAIERHAAARASLAEREQRTLAEQREAEAEENKARGLLEALPPSDAARAEVARLRAEGDAARLQLADARAAAATLAQSIEGDRRRRDAARNEVRSWKARAGDAAKRIEEMDRRIAEAVAEMETLAGAPERLDGEITGLALEAEAATARAADAQQAERTAEAGLREAEATALSVGEALAAAREARAGAVARLENQELRRVEMGRISGERFECPAPVLPGKIGFAEDDVADAAAESARHEKLTADRERLGPVNLVAETELRELDETRAASQAEREDLGLAIARLRGSIGSLNREGRARLMAAFEAVDQHFRRLFTTLFAGGEAHLALIDSDDPLEAGLEIMAQPPGKKLGSLTLLSGGEQALTAVALIFALFLTNPAPICVLDEVDAPLDDANIERFCDLLDRMTQETDTRYLIVTHNAVTMSRMHRLFGVTMVERGVSRLVSVDLGGAETLLAAAE